MTGKRKDVEVTIDLDQFADFVEDQHNSAMTAMRMVFGSAMDDFLAEKDSEHRENVRQMRETAQRLKGGM